MSCILLVFEFFCLIDERLPSYGSKCAWLQKYFSRTIILNVAYFSYRDLGAHLDGFPAVVAHSLVVGSSPEKKATGRHADVILAAHYAFEAALRLMKGGNENYMVRLN